ncbi:ornithine--oxo-acid transaminase [candidate division KSB1 bacterium]|nr:ornithine--oxo-acid transaminase [candidate division KSB1 bacterium]RQW08546.1 MAG: ornithine--oxo-acid transaminase [candidate division KSB1 bacterium]
MNSQTFIQIEEQFGAHNYFPLDVVINRGAGVWLYDVNGAKYMDFLSAYSAVNQGHCHPRLVARMREQCEKLTLTSRAFRNDQFPLLLKELCELTGFDRALLMNSGAEAVETAIKAARKWGYTVKGIEAERAEIIVATNNFHGRTTTIVGFSTEEQYKKGFGPFTPGFITVEYGDIAALKRAVSPNTVAVLLEPIQGEGGIIIPPPGHLEAIQALCREQDILFILDEIQSGLGRCGKLFAYQYEDVQPDGIVIGKALSGGFYPVSAFLAREGVMDVFKPGDHGSTFGGNPLACAVAREALAVLLEEKLPERSFELGGYLREKLSSIKSPYIKEIRGRGLMIGIELLAGARRFCEALKKEGLLCKETHATVIRLTPPLVIDEQELDWAFQKIEAVLQS